MYSVAHSPAFPTRLGKASLNWFDPSHINVSLHRRSTQLNDRCHTGSRRIILYSSITAWSSLYKGVVLVTLYRVSGIKANVVDLYSAPSWETHFWSTQVWITQLLHCKHTIIIIYLHLVTVHQTAPRPLTVIAAIWLQLTAHLSTRRGWKAELA